MWETMDVYISAYPRYAAGSVSARLRVCPARPPGMQWLAQ
jgi:hypothetical protein